MPNADLLGIGGEVREFHWNWKGKPVTIVYEVLGQGKPLLLLPALSSVSTRSEMKSLAKSLAQFFQVIVPDWVGFGESSRPGFAYRPALYRAFLLDFTRAVFSEPVAVIAAGHAAGYIMQLAPGANYNSPSPWSMVVLIAPTWRGPLPTAMGEHRWFYNALRFLIRLPLLGQFLYLLNTMPPFLGWMYCRHVYADPNNVTRPLMMQKWRTTQKRGGRFASAAFVTGALDPVRSSREFLDFFQPLPLPVLMVVGEQTPPKSRKEMEVLAHFSGVQVHRMPGSLGLHEEYADLLAEQLLPLLKQRLS